MTSEEREDLEEALELARENNRILRGMRRSARFARFVRVLFWIGLIVLGYFIYVWIEPYLESIQQASERAGELNAELNNALDDARGLIDR